MPQILMPYTVHLDHTLRVTPLNTLFAKGDTAAHRFELTILRSGVQEELTGCKVVCKFYRMAESAVVDVDGTIEDGKAVAVLNMACYDYIGRFALTIAIQNGEEKTTVFYGDGYMHGPRADTLISGEYIIYDINTLLEKIAEIDAATQAANTAASNANTATANANTAATNADEKAAKADAAAKGASGWANATATVHTLDAGADATVSLTNGADGTKNLDLGIPRGNSGVYTGPDEPTDPTIDVWIDSDGEADELPSGVTPEEIQAAVDSYLDANPVTSGATAEQAAQIEANKNAIAELKQSGTGTPGADGEDGGYYAPAVDTSGNLTWTPSKADMPSVSGANIKGPAGSDGATGADGYSPTISVEAITGGHRVTITDATGTHYFDVMDGTDGSGGSGSAGADGYSPTVSVTEISGGHRVSITDVNGTKTFDVLDGADGAQGPQGPQGDTGATGATGATGPAGADGYTPVRGTDYWTASDQQQIVSDVLAALPTWTGGAY